MYAKKNKGLVNVIDLEVLFSQSPDQINLHQDLIDPLKQEVLILEE